LKKDHQKDQNNIQESKRNRWLRVVLLSFTLLGPIVNTIVERMRQRSQPLQNNAQTAQTAARQRFDELTEAEGLLEPVRQRKGTFWAVLGFSLGLTAALVVTYLFVRQRLLQPETDEGQQIELPQNEFHESTPTTAVEEPSAQPTTGE
jgi:hypothetical protein